jgi:hypothetical protein
MTRTVPELLSKISAYQMDHLNSTTGGTHISITTAFTLNLGLTKPKPRGKSAEARGCPPSSSELKEFVEVHLHPHLFLWHGS